MKQQHRKRVAIALEKVIISENVQDTRLNRPLTKKMNTWNNYIDYIDYIVGRIITLVGQCG